MLLQLQNCLSTLAGNLANVCRQHQDKTSGSAGHELPEPDHREVAHLADYGLAEDVTGGGAPDVHGQGLRDGLRYPVSS